MSLVKVGIQTQGERQDLIHLFETAHITTSDTLQPELVGSLRESISIRRESCHLCCESQAPAHYSCIKMGCGTLLSSVRLLQVEVAADSAALCSLTAA